MGEKKKENWQLKCEKTNIKKKDLYSELLEVKNMYKKGKNSKSRNKSGQEIDGKWKKYRELNRSRKHILPLCRFLPATDGVKSQTFPCTG